MASKSIIIRCIRTGSKPYGKIMYSIVLQTIFHQYLNENNKINISYVSPAFVPSGLTKLVLKSYNF